MSWWKNISITVKLLMNYHQDAFIKFLAIVILYFEDFLWEVRGTDGLWTGENCWARIQHRNWCKRGSEYFLLTWLRYKVEHISRMEITSWTFLHTNSSLQTSSSAKLSTVPGNISLEFLTIEMLMSLTRLTLTTFKVRTENRLKSECRPGEFI